MPRFLDPIPVRRGHLVGQKLVQQVNGHFQPGCLQFPTVPFPLSFPLVFCVGRLIAPTALSCIQPLETRRPPRFRLP